MNVAIPMNLPNVINLPVMKTTSPTNFTTRPLRTVEAVENVRLREKRQRMRRLREAVKRQAKLQKALLQRIVKIDTENQIRHKLKTAYVGQTKSGKPMYRLWDGHLYTVAQSPSVDTSILADSPLGGPGWYMVHSSDMPPGHTHVL